MQAFAQAMQSAALSDAAAPNTDVAPVFLHSLATCGLSSCQIARHPACRTQRDIVVLIAGRKMYRPSTNGEVTHVACHVTYNSTPSARGCRRVTSIEASLDAVKELVTYFRNLNSAVSTAPVRHFDLVAEQVAEHGATATMPRTMIQCVRYCIDHQAPLDDDARVALDSWQGFCGTKRVLTLKYAHAKYWYEYNVPIPCFVYVGNGHALLRQGNASSCLPKSNVRIKYGATTHCLLNWYRDDICVGCGNVRSVAVCARCATVPPPLANSTILALPAHLQPYAYALYPQGIPPLAGSSPAPLPATASVTAAPTVAPYRIASQRASELKFGTHVQHALDAMFDRDVACATCMDDMRVGDAYLAPSCCGAVFCTKRADGTTNCEALITDWMRTKGICPSCRGARPIMIQSTVPSRKRPRAAEEEGPPR